MLDQPERLVRETLDLTEFLKKTKGSDRERFRARVLFSWPGHPRWERKEGRG